MNHHLISKNTAASYNEGWPLGNGHIGCITYGKMSSSVTVINDSTFYEGRPIEGDSVYAAFHAARVKKLLFEQDYGKAEDVCDKYLSGAPAKLSSYREMGRIFVDLKGDFFDYERKLSFADSVLEESASSSDGAGVKRTSFISVEEDCLFTRIAFSAAMEINISLAGPFGSRYGRKEDVLYFQGTLNDGENDNMRYAAGMRVFSDGLMQESEKGVKIKKATDVVIVYSSVTDYCPCTLSFDREKDVVKDLYTKLESVKYERYEDYLDCHRKEASSLYGRSSIDIPQCVDTVNTYNYGKYLLMSASRKDSPLPAGAYGIWSEGETNENSGFYLDGDLQWSYGAAHVTNMSAVAEPLEKFAGKLASRGEYTAAFTYNVNNGWSANRETDIFGNTAIHGGKHGVFPMGGLWLSKFLWDNFEYTGGMGLLMKHAPVMKGACTFAHDYMVPNLTRRHMVTPAVIPGVSFMYDGKKRILGYGSTQSMGIVDDLFDKTVAAHTVLADRGLIEKPGINAIKHKHKHVIPYKISERYGGTLQEWFEDYEQGDPEGVHLAHLYPLYPGDTISLSTPELFEGCRQSVKRQLGFGIEKNRDRVNAAALCARLFESERFSTLVDSISDIKKTADLPTFCGFTAAVTEAVVQSHEGGVGERTIRFLPCLPREWRSGSFKGLRLRGAVSADGEWRDGRLVKAVLVPDGDTVIRIFAENGLKVNGESIFSNEGRVSFEAKANTPYVIENL